MDLHSDFLYVTKYFSINFSMLVWLLLCHFLFFSSSVSCKGPCSIHNDFHCFEVVSFDLLVGQSAVALCCCDPAVAE